MQSPLNAGLPTVALPSEWAVGQNFSQAVKHAAELTDLVGENEGGPDLGEKLLEAVGQLTAQQSLQALVVGSIGVVAHCSEIQWNCFNQALKEFQEKGDLLLTSG